MKRNTREGMSLGSSFGKFNFTSFLSLYLNALQTRKTIRALLSIEREILKAISARNDISRILKGSKVI